MLVKISEIDNLRLVYIQQRLNLLKEKAVSLVFVQLLTKTYQAGELAVPAIKDVDFSNNPSSFFSFVCQSGNCIKYSAKCFDHSPVACYKC